MDKASFIDRVCRDYAAVWTKLDNTALQAYADAVEKIEILLPEDQQASIYAAAESLLNAYLLREFPLPLIINEWERV